MNTRDLSKFGYRELALAGQLLTALGSPRDNDTNQLDVGVCVEFNPESAMVFLVDEDFNVAVMEGDKLVDFLSCPNCGTEGTPSDFGINLGLETCCEEMFQEYKGFET